MKTSPRQPNPVNGFQLTFFTQQDHRHHHKSLAHWLVEEARAMGIGGATLIAGSEGFGHHRRLHQMHLINLSDQPLEVVMAVTAEEAERFFAKLEAEKIKVFYSKTPVEFGTIGGEE
jgi:PII-like signaling protein